MKKNAKNYKKIFLAPEFGGDRPFCGVLHAVCDRRIQWKPAAQIKKTEKIVNFQKKSYFLLILKEFWCIINLYVDFAAVGITAALSK